MGRGRRLDHSASVPLRLLRAGVVGLYTGGIRLWLWPVLLVASIPIFGEAGATHGVMSVPDRDSLVTHEPHWIPRGARSHP